DGRAIAQPHTAELDELREEPTESVRFDLDEASQRVVVTGLEPAVGDLLDAAADRGERVTDLVRERGRELGDRLEPRGAAVQLLEALAIGDVLEDGGRPGCAAPFALDDGRTHADRPPARCGAGPLAPPRRARLVPADRERGRERVAELCAESR